MPGVPRALQYWVPGAVGSGVPQVKVAYELARHWRNVPVYEALLLQDGVVLPHGKPVTPEESAPELPGELPP